MAPRLVRKTARFALPDRAARIAVVADTHSRPHPEMAAHLAALAPDAILHAGDIGELSVLDGLALAAPLYAVRGNIDGRGRGLPDQLVLDLTGRDGSLRVFLVHIAVQGARLRADVARAAQADQAQLVVCGHSHVPFIGQDRGLAVFNPGSVGPRRFHLPIVFGVMELEGGRLSLRHVDCETGATWRPPP